MTNLAQSSHLVYLVNSRRLAHLDLFGSVGQSGPVAQFGTSVGPFGLFVWQAF